MTNKRKTQLDELRELCESDLYTFASYINPQYVYGDVHRDLAQFLMQDDDDQLVLLPRGHLKSHWMAMDCAWRITRNPEITIGYCSATEQLALEQLSVIKNVLESERYRLLWPDMTNPDVGKRERWASASIKVDHPIRKAEAVRDATVHAFGINGNTTGLHFDRMYFDDVVVEDNVATEDLRSKTAASHSQLSASVLNVGGKTKTSGTIWHPKDLYSVMLGTVVETDEGQKSIYKVFRRTVEEHGSFLWPRTERNDGKKFGMDDQQLAKIKAKYISNSQLPQFFMQYYNDPNSAETARFDRSRFQYYDRRYIHVADGSVFFKQEKLNVFAAIDFAYSLNKKADYTAIVVIGMDSNKFIYVLDIDRFKTKNPEDYFHRVFSLHEKWHLKRLRVEVTSAQVIICQYLKDRIRELGLNLSIDEHRPTRHHGTKEERIIATLDPLYQNGSVWHYNGGLIHLLEEELLLDNPQHDDIKDAFASAIEVARAPKKNGIVIDKMKKFNFSSRFGGIR